MVDNEVYISLGVVKDNKAENEIYDSLGPNGDQRHLDISTCMLKRA